MNAKEIIDFLETDRLSYTFSDNGLQYLSLYNNNGDEQIDLKTFDMEKEDNPKKRLLIEETINFIETGNHKMPLDLTRFTVFQQSVLNAIREIGKGSILTYKEVGMTIGNPGAAQAVGNATSKNPVSYFIPTHRVLPKRGLARCNSGAGHLKYKLLTLEGHDIEKLKGNYVCERKKCVLE